jgi:hypothetical protein
MRKKDPRVHRYTQRAQPFARPILKHLRRLVHRACPDVDETIKWQSPFFERKGFICCTAAFKTHAIFGFWKSRRLFGKKYEGAMGHFGRIMSLADLPSDSKLGGIHQESGGTERTRSAKKSGRHAVCRS